MRTAILLVIGAALASGCASDSDPFAAIDGRYADILVRLGSAERDTTRNVRNKEARDRLSAAEQERVAFFHSADVQKVIEIGEKAPAGSPARVKAAEYRLQALKYKPGDPTATVGLADARYGMHMANGTAFMAGKKYGSAVDEFEAALKAKPNDTSATNALSQARFKLLNEKMTK